jgi:Ca2+-binding EF-hand superfamily protein
MGCLESSIDQYAHIYIENPQLASWMKEFHSLALTDRAVFQFWQIFKKIDMDGSGSIEIAEMLVHFDIERTKFTKRVFGIFDEDGSGEIDLREFIMALWNYCTLGKSTLIIFAFDLYDKDGSGIIDSEELGLMLQEVYGSNYENNQYAKKYVLFMSCHFMSCRVVLSCM